MNKKRGTITNKKLLTKKYPINARNVIGSPFLKSIIGNFYIYDNIYNKILVANGMERISRPGGEGGRRNYVYDRVRLFLKFSLSLLIRYVPIILYLFT